MPNHVHGLVHLHRAPVGMRAHSVGDVVGAFKAAVSRNLARGLTPGGLLACVITEASTETGIERIDQT